jgi:hypothetical protein
VTDPGAGHPDEEELRRRFEEELKRVRVEDVIVQTAVTLVNLAGRKLGLMGDAGERDLGQAKLAIEGARALQPLLPGEAQAAVRDALSQLQMAFAREAQGGGQPAGGAPEGEPEPPPAPPKPPPPKIWTPPGTAS